MKRGEGESRQMGNGRKGRDALQLGDVTFYAQPDTYDFHSCSFKHWPHAVLWPRPFTQMYNEV